MRRRRSVGTLVAAAVLLLILVTACVSPVTADLKTPTASESPSCADGSNRLVHEFPSGTSWEMCWKLDDYRGIVLSDVAYRARYEEQSIPVLYNLSIAQLNVQYDDGRTQYNDVTEFGLGAGFVQVLESSDCPDGEILKVEADICAIRGSGTRPNAARISTGTSPPMASTGGTEEDGVAGMTLLRDQVAA